MRGGGAELFKKSLGRMNITDCNASSANRLSFFSLMEFVNKYRVGKCLLIRMMPISNESGKHAESYSRLKWTSQNRQSFSANLTDSRFFSFQHSRLLTAGCSTTHSPEQRSKCSPLHQHSPHLPVPVMRRLFFLFLEHLHVRNATANRHLNRNTHTLVLCSHSLLSGPPRVQPTAYSCIIKGIHAVVSLPMLNLEPVNDNGHLTSHLHEEGNRILSFHVRTCYCVVDDSRRGTTCSHSFGVGKAFLFSFSYFGLGNV